MQGVRDSGSGRPACGQWRGGSLPGAEVGVDVDGARAQLLSLIVNEGVSRIDPTEVGFNPFTVGAVLRDMAARGLVTVHMISDETFSIMGVSPLARRALRG